MTYFRRRSENSFMICFRREGQGEDEGNDSASSVSSFARHHILSQHVLNPIIGLAAKQGGHLQGKKAAASLKDC
jgi:hypothetical protein